MSETSGGQPADVEPDAASASMSTVEEWLAQTRRRPTGIRRDAVLEALDELRGPWPDARS